MAIEHILDEILKAEGWPKYTNDPNDWGGPTKGGITQKTLAEWRENKSVTADDVRNLEEEEVRAIYEREYITRPNFHKINNELLREHVVDAGVLHGQGTVAKWLQAIAGVKADGVLGLISVGAINAMSPRDVSIKFAVMRIRYMGRTINNNYKARKAALTDQDQSGFAEGWLIRATSFLLEI